MIHLASEFNKSDPVVASFFIERASAIASYATVEQALADLFAHLLGADPDYAGVPFFRINNARARNGILERLLKKRHGAEFNLFWNCLVNYLQALDAERNQIVHWGMLAVVNKKNGKLLTIKLTPPNYWDRSQHTPKMTMEEIENFGHRCNFMTRAIDLLCLVASGKAQDASWRDICRQPITYPPPGNHPLSLTSKELRSQLRP